MTTEAAIKMTTRFRLNIQRISGLTRLLFAEEGPIENKSIFQYDGVAADIWRAAVVFLHATFEGSLETLNPKPVKSGIYSRADLDKALRRVGLDPIPFRTLYPPLTQMAKRRKRIVHEGDMLPTGVVEDIGFTDMWVFGMWNMAVVAFHYQLLFAKENKEHTRQLWSQQYESVKEAMMQYTEFGKVMGRLDASKGLDGARATLADAASALDRVRDLITSNPPKDHPTQSSR